MNRPAPELALVVGAVLAVPFAAYGVLFSDAVLWTLLASVVVLYAFAAFAISRDDDPTTVLPTRSVLAATGVFGALAVGYGLAVATPLLGLLVALVAVVPALRYRQRYGDASRRISPVATLVVAVLAAAAVVVYGVAVADASPVASVDAALLLLAALDDRAVRDAALGPAGEMVAVALCTGGGALVVLYFVATGRPTTGLGLAAPLLAVGAFLALE
ncbi:MAG: hypothetical protein ABEJ23_09465 [Haloarculaceae archaeon]